VTELNWVNALAPN